MRRKKAVKIKLRGDNQSMCVENLSTGKIQRIKRWRAWELVDDKNYKFASNSQWRAQKRNEKPAKEEVAEVSETPEVTEKVRAPRPRRKKQKKDK